ATEAVTRLDTAKADAKSKLDAAAAAKDAAKAAEARKAASAKAASEAKLALEPVSIYISRATQKLYVRRNTHKPAPDGGGEVFDSSIEVPATIRNPDRPIGTHVFTAVARNDTGLRWTAVTIDDANNAKDALDRITIPQDVVNRIAPTALPRSSIIISDEPLSAETNYRTEFVAVLSNQPQGGFITREPSTEALVASDNVRNDGGFGFLFQRNWSPQTGNARRQGGQGYR
ncbi:MAG: L,D-transpeptidase, partial [Pseudolabrys sp.]